MNANTKYQVIEKAPGRTDHVTANCQTAQEAKDRAQWEKAIYPEIIFEVYSLLSKRVVARY